MSATLDIPERRTLGRGDVKTLLLSALGGALEFYDFVIFVYFAKTIGHLFFPPGTSDWLAQLQAFGIFAVAYLARPLGGIVMAHFGDRIGRKRMFMLSVFLMAVPTLLIGVLPTYATLGVLAPLLLTLLRVLQGLAIGGEVPGAWVFVAEHVPQRRVGLAVASLSAGLTAGILMGSLLAAWLNASLSEADMLDHGWRIAFILGGVFGFFAVYLRRWLSETPVFARMRERKELAEELPALVVVRDHLPGVLLSMTVTWVLTAAIVVVILMTPTLMQTAFHIVPARAFAGGSIAALTLCFGCIGGGLLVDRVGTARAMLIASLGLTLSTYALYLDLQAGGANLFPLYALAGVFAGVAGIVPAILVASFPPAIRFSGISVSYNIAYAIAGAATPVLVGYLARTAGGLGPAHYVAIVALAGVAASIYMMRTGRGSLRR
ncbi:putative MFS family arabinose efflux permease [Luteibacter sp. OK325]|uniref:MFS transporter n=1 Tax=Luteibacter sp. OK325 TaxID=2135670 RepID=UPI000D3CF63E|nr:MFS transporter [Luteibacter sp. OK325]PTR34961.1 putative MFS family arabinose efflux permease [Luteibacter sp. OK325]